jgi:hypothetical protein
MHDALYRPTLIPGASTSQLAANPGAGSGHPPTAATVNQSGSPPDTDTAVAASSPEYPRWTEWSWGPELEVTRAAAECDRRRRRCEEWGRTILAYCSEPEGLRPLLSVTVADQKDIRAALSVMIHEVVRMMRWCSLREGIVDCLSRDAAGKYVPGVVLRDVTISLGPEVLAIVNITEEGPVVIRIPRADLGHDLPEDDLTLGHGDGTVMEWVYEPMGEGPY